MKITAEKDQQSQYIVTIEIDPAELDDAKGKAAKRLATKVRIPGFRPGKAPRALVERFVGQEALLEEATRSLMPKAYQEALSREDIKPIGEPDFRVGSTDPLTLIATIPVEPTVEVGDYKDIKFDMPEVEEKPEEVEKTIEQLREQNSTWEEPTEERPAQEGDQVEVELVTLRDGEETGEPFTRSGVLGKGEMLEALDEQIVGMGLNEEKVVEINRNKPAEPETTEPTETGNTDKEEQDIDEGQAAAIAAANVNEEASAEATAEIGTVPDLPEVETIPLSAEEEASQNQKPLTFRVKLNSIKIKHEPDLNDDFAASVSDLKTMDELRERVRNNLKTQAENESRRDLVDKIVKEVVSRSSVQMPPILVDQQIHLLEENMDQRLKQQKLSLEQYLRLTGKDHEALHEELRPQAEEQLKNGLVLRELAQQEGITVDERDIDAEVEKMVKQYTESAPEETRAEQAERIRGIFNRKETRDQMSNDVYSRKLGNRLILLATGVDLDAQEAAEAEAALNLKNDQNAATQASEEKLEMTQGDISFASDSNSETNTEPEGETETETEAPAAAVHTEPEYEANAASIENESESETSSSKEESK